MSSDRHLPAERAVVDHGAREMLFSTQLAEREAFRLPVLASRADFVVAQGRAAGVGVVHVGNAPVFTDRRLLVGRDSTWVVTPAAGDPARHRGHFPVPREQLSNLRALVAAGVDFPAVYTAHEAGDPTADGQERGPGVHALSSAAAATIVGPVPSPGQVVDLSNRLGRTTAAIGAGTRRVLPVLAGIAAVPVLAAVAVAAAVAGSEGLDPVIFGVLTESGSATPGEMGAWILLAQWTW